MYLSRDFVLSIMISKIYLNTLAHQQQTHKRKIKSLIPHALFCLSPPALCTKLSSCHSVGHIVLSEPS